MSAVNHPDYERLREIRGLLVETASAEFFPFGSATSAKHQKVLEAYQGLGHLMTQLRETSSERLQLVVGSEPIVFSNTIASSRPNAEFGPFETIVLDTCGTRGAESGEHYYYFLGNDRLGIQTTFSTVGRCLAQMGGFEIVPMDVIDPRQL